MFFSLVSIRLLKLFCISNVLFSTAEDFSAATPRYQIVSWNRVVEKEIWANESVAAEEVHNS